MAEVENPAVAIEETMQGEEDNGKRKRETENSVAVEGDGGSIGDQVIAPVKKPKVDVEAEEVIEQEVVNKGEGKEEEVPAQLEKNKDQSVAAEVSLGPKTFGNAVDLFSYFYKLLQLWPMNVDTNKYETMVLTDLLLKGHTNAPGKVGAGIEAFQVQMHPTWKSRCYYIVRVDGSCDDFSYRKCCDQILPLPAEYVSNGKVCIDMLNIGDIYKFKDMRAEEGYGEGSRGRGGGRGFRGGGGGRGGAGGKWGGGSRGGRGGAYRGGGNRGRGRGGRGRW